MLKESNGNTYEGLWTKGVKNGLGKITYFKEGQEVVEYGDFLNGVLNRSVK